jgi:hypothetical protein
MVLNADEIRTLYRNPATGLKGMTAFIREVRKTPAGRDTPASAIRQALMEDETWALSARRVSPRAHRRVVVRTLDDVWTADLADVSAHAKVNDNVRFLLVIVDVLSGFLWCQPLQTKTAVAVRHGLEAVLRTGRKPNHLWTDEGGEWKGAFRTFCDAKGIAIYHTGGEGKAVVAERMIRTLRGRLGRLAEARGTWRYKDALPELVANINATVSRPIGMAPKDVNAQNAAAVARKRYEDVDAADRRLVDTAVAIEQKPKYSIGDLVRVSIVARLFEKEGERNVWSHELFRVVGVEQGTPVQYTLADIDPESGSALQGGEPLVGKFYEEEMAEAVAPDTFKVVVKKRLPRGKVRVGWLGWPDKYDQVVLAKTVKDI